MISSLLYIGAGVDVSVTKYFSQVEKFILVDTQPRSEFDRPGYFEPLFYRKRFYNLLTKNFTEYGFYLYDIKILDIGYYNKIFNWKQWIYYKLFKCMLPQYINPTLLYFRNDETNQIVKYYISTNFQHNMCKELNRDILESDGIIVSGHHPNIKLLEYFDTPKKFYGSTSTYFGYEVGDEDPDDNIVTFSYKNPLETFKYFSEYHLIDFENKLYHGEYKNINELDLTRRQITKNLYTDD